MDSPGELGEGPAELLTSTSLCPQRLTLTPETSPSLSISTTLATAGCPGDIPITMTTVPSTLEQN